MFLRTPWGRKCYIRSGAAVDVLAGGYHSAMLIPLPLPDELLASFLARLGRLNGIKDLRDATNYCSGQADHASFIDARLDLPEFCRRTYGALGDPGALLKSHTWFAARRQLGEIEEGDWNALLIGTAKLNIAEATFIEGAALRYCESCRSKDIDDYGLAYWHILHQLPAAGYCAIHRERLVDVRLKRSFLHSAFPLPGDFETECLAANAGQNDMFKLEAAIFFAALLSTNIERQDFLEQLLLDALFEQRLITKDGRICARQLSNGIAEGMMGAPANTIACEAKRRIKRLIRSIDNPAQGLPLGRALLLSYYVGNWQLVTNRCIWIASLECASSSTGLWRAKAESSDLRHLHRTRCLDFIASKPDGSRLEFIRSEYRAFRWLLRNDRPWLDRQLPIPRCAGRQMALF